MIQVQLASIFFVIGIYLGLIFKIEPFYLIPLLLFSVSVMFVPIPRHFPRYTVLFFVLGICIATINGFNQSQNFNDLECDANATILGVLEQSKDRIVFDARIDQGFPKEIINHIFRCYSKYGPNLELGDVVQVKGYIHSAIVATNPGQFDFKTYLDRQNINGVVNLIVPPRVLKMNNNWISLLGPRIRQKTIETYSVALPKRYALMLDSLVFGKAELPKDIQENFQRTGTTHVLAASGFNVTIVAFASMSILLWIFGSRKGSIVGAIVITLLYTATAGFSPSVSRALIMAVLSMGALIIGRKYSTASGLSVAVFILLALKPTWLFEASFQLSFVSSLVFFVATPFIQRFLEKSKKYKKILTIVLQSVLIQILTMPILAYHFHTFSLASPVANTIAIPLSEIITPIGALSALISTISQPVGIVLSWIAWPLLILMDYALIVLASPSWVLISVSSMPLLVWIPYYITLGIAYKLYKSPQKVDKIKLLYVGSLFILVGFIVGIIISIGAQRIAQVTFLDVGHGDAIYIRTPTGKTILIDGGGETNLSNFNPGERIVLPFLRFSGVNRLDLVIATHMDQDHIGGLIKVLDQIGVKLVIKSNISSDIYREQDLKEILEEKRINFIVPCVGQTINLDKDSSIFFFGPPKEPLGNDSNSTNNGSVVCKITIDRVSFLLTGDIGKAGMIFELDDKGDLHSDVIKLPHHGEYNESLPRYLSDVMPKIAINSDSAREGTGAHVKTDQLLQTMKIQMLSTARLGAITFNIKNGKYSVVTFIK